jgi:type IV pilus assembly protein PilM
LRWGGEQDAMSIVRRIFPSDIDALRPRLACEITPAGVLAARPGSVAEAGQSQDVVTHFAPLRLGVLVPGLKTPAMTDRAVVSAAIEQALEPIAERAKKVTVVVPDASVRVLLLDFDTLPTKVADVLPILRFRLRKLVHFDVDDAAISWQMLPQAQGETLVRTVVAVMPAAVRAEYEDAVREAGYEPGAVLSSSLAALAAVPGEEPTLLVNRNGNCITTAIARGSQLLLFRTMELGEGGVSRMDGGETSEAEAVAELQQTVSVAMAYYEDTLASTAHTIYSVGPGGAGELDRLLALPGIRVRDLIPSRDGSGAATGSATTGMLAPVVGALAS